MVVYCAYCGKQFTRKEHLERHLPTHTNVKPHRCGQCQLSFARRDLLQRHHSTYHEARDPMEPLPGGVPTVAGRTPIACQNCASAKTGCDKRVPCGRCSEKNLPCSARFARRSSKAAVRAAQALTTHQTQLGQSPQQLQQTQTIDPSFMEMDQSMTKVELGNSPTTIEAVISMDGSPKSNSPIQSHVSPADTISPHTRMNGLEDFNLMGNDFAGQESYQDLFVFDGYGLELGDMYHNPLPLVRTEMAMPFTELSDMEAASEPMTASSSRGSIHTRGTSIMSTSDFDNVVKPVELTMAVPPDSSIPEFEVVIAAEGAWNLARCNRPMYTGTTCPRTAIVHLECLEQKSKQEGTWSSLEKYLEEVDRNATDLASVVPLTARTRDKMLAITQSFLHKALEIHRGGINTYPKAGYASPGDFNFIVLPPSKILEYFLSSYVRSLSVYYPLVVAGCVDPNEMIQNNQASTLLVLLMIAQGAAAMPMAEARYLSAGLTETCRISLFDIVEKDVELSADPIALRCALLFIVLGAWSGDKWLMDIAMGQRGMYMSMLKHAGMMDPQPSMIPTFNDPSSNTEHQWRAWLHRESLNRLVYNYVMLDQELSLFHDTAPLLAINELQCPLPAPEVLWSTPNAERWRAAIQTLYGNTTNVNPQLLNSPSVTPSLYDLFQDFLQDTLSKRGSLSPQQLRLILHPIQSLLCHLRQMLSCFDVFSARRVPSAGGVSLSSTMQRLEEVQQLLRKWYDLTMTYYRANPGCAITRCNMVLYHLISLNAVTNFPEIERLARREGFDGSSTNPYWELSLRHKRCIYQREEALFHCGQVFRHLRSMPNDRRPSWWSAAMYRATLILWVDSICRLDPNFQTEKPQSTGSPSFTPVAIDQITPEDTARISYLWCNPGVGVLTRLDGGTISLDKPDDVLSYAVKNIESGFSSRIGDGIKRKIIALSNNWSADTMGGASAA
ncbi:hypothetical protein B0H66DRAFT_113549 [Apodospora peruviana]|uniref:Uncharacterized protein n=1 Tax=Apodospora peruviana TaxID=516989 RepID=A0AAE0IHK7_9PEZI|nr:hypothetical protein B0H66DRAFT_113549 [Apodospora peruviana]